MALTESQLYIGFSPSVAGVIAPRLGRTDILGRTGEV